MAGLPFELSLEFYLGPNFPDGFPGYLCGISLLVYQFTPVGDGELGADLCFCFMLWMGVALVSSCQMALGPKSKSVCSRA